MTRYYNDTEFAGTAVEIAHDVYLNNAGIGFEISDSNPAIATLTKGDRSFSVGTEFDTDEDGEDTVAGYTWTDYLEGEEGNQGGDDTLDTLKAVIDRWIAE